MGFADFSTDFGAGHMRHDPVEDGHGRAVWLGEDIPGLIAVFCHHDLVAPTQERTTEQNPGGCAVVGNKNFHSWRRPLRYQPNRLEATSLKV